MKVFFGFTVVLISILNAFGQSSTAAAPSPTPTRQRVVISSTVTPTPAPTPYRVSVPAPAPYLTPSPTPTSTPAPKVTVITTSTLPPPSFSPTPVMSPRPAVTPTSTTIINPTPADNQSNVAYRPNPTLPFKILTLAQLRSKIAEAKSLLQSRPMPTAWTDTYQVTDMIRMAFYDTVKDQIDFIVMTKSTFLQRDIQVPIMSLNGKMYNVRILRANGVNTAITIFDQTGQPTQPLVVQYPIEKSGSLREMAYYISTHPGVVTAEVIGAGRLYVHNTLDIARQKLQDKGIYIAPQVADIAERLSTVEHVDHQRFWSESQPNLYNEIFSLYALNEGNTYRYSVSSAGAGGMVQMIPSTYYMIRSRYYNVGLIPDFVEGMRNHVNAAQAMLLYMQMTWSDLYSNETIYNALGSGIATQAELMAAGYNSNPAKLPGYIQRGGANWKTLIPRETKIYLQIYSSLESAVPMIPRSK